MSRPPFTVPLPKQGADALFSLAPSLAVGSLYIDPHKVLCKTSITDGRPLFRPAGVLHFDQVFPTLTVSTVEPSTVTKKASTIIRGIYVNRSNEAFEKFPEYTADPAQAKIEARRKAVEKEQERMKNLPAFKVSAPGLMPFSKDKDLFYSLVPRGGVMKTKEGTRQDQAFRPAGTCPALSKYPEYIGDPEVKTVHKKESGTVGSWKPSDATVKTKAAPSVAFNVLNLRKELH
jgi:hypothetical protein